MVEIFQPFNLDPTDYVSSLNGLTGDITLAPGSNISIDTIGDTITVNSTGGSHWDNPYGDATFTYDVNGNVETKTVDTTVLTYSYDVDGNVETITDGTNVKTFTYDVDGNVETIVYT